MLIIAPFLFVVVYHPRHCHWRLIRLEGLCWMCLCHYCYLLLLLSRLILVGLVYLSVGYSIKLGRVLGHGEWVIIIIIVIGIHRISEFVHRDSIKLGKVLVAAKDD